MGKSQSKLSAEQLADLQKNTYCQSSNDISSQIAYFHCSRQERTPTMVHLMPFNFPYNANLSTGTKVLRKTVLLVISIRQNLVGYTNSSFHLAILPNLLIMFSTSLMRTRAGKSISRSSSVHSVLPAEAV